MSAFEDYCIVCEKLCKDGSAYCSNDCKMLDEERSNSPTLSVCSGLHSISGSSFSLQNSHSQSNVKSYSNSISSINNSNLNLLMTSNNPINSTCAGPGSGSGANTNTNTATNTNTVTNTNIIPTTMISPLLTPQVMPRSSIVSCVKSPNIKDLTYESPLLSCSNSNSNVLNSLNDLDANHLDLNSISLDNSNSINSIHNANTANNSSISKRLSKSFAAVNTDTTKNINTTSNATSNSTSNTVHKKRITNVSNMLHSSSENYKKWLSIH